jgi:hypothetical protein
VFPPHKIVGEADKLCKKGVPSTFIVAVAVAEQPVDADKPVTV